MILLTDGHDYGHDWNQSKTIDPRDCEALKRNGIGLYVFNTKWVADWGNWAFDPILGYKANPLGGGTVFEALGPKLKECSSGQGFYFEGTDAGDCGYVPQNFPRHTNQDASVDVKVASCGSFGSRCGRETVGNYAQRLGPLGRKKPRRWGPPGEIPEGEIKGVKQGSAKHMKAHGVSKAELSAC